METENSEEPTADHQKPKKLIRSKFKDVMVKVDEDIYYVDRLRLALRSGYFEKLFTEDYRDRNCDLIEIPMMDTDTFSAAVDLIYGRKLKYVIDDNNYVSLLMAMDYLQMKIDEDDYGKILDYQLGWCSTFSNEIFTLYHFIVESANYQSLLSVVYKHLSLHILKIQDLQEYLSMPFDHLIHIISQREYRSDQEEYKKHELSKVCAKWICHDIENRLPSTIDLVNAARYRHFISNKLSKDDTNLQLPAIDKCTNEEKVSRYFYKWLLYCGEISRCVGESRLEVYEKEKQRDTDQDEQLYGRRNSTGDIEQNLISPPYEPKLQMFLENGLLYDITVKAGEKLYKLHRVALEHVCVYFEEIFSKEHTELSAQCEGVPPPLPSKDKIYFIDDIDSETFDSVVQAIYKMWYHEFTSSGVVVRSFKAGHKLKNGCLKSMCEEWMTSNSESMCAEDVIEMLDFTREVAEYKSLYQFFLTKCITDSWPKILNSPQFADIYKELALPMETYSKENEPCLFDEIDQETFKLIVDYVVYLDRVKVDRENIVRFLKASEFFKIAKLVNECAKWLASHPQLVESEDVVEVLKFASRNIEYREILNSVYLAKYMIRWPLVDNSLFCPISCDCLENLLTSPEFFLDDPLEMLDMCSKWVMHDVENRYCLISRIALAISRNRVADCDDYPIANPADFDNCSQVLIKDKIWKILSSTSVLPFAVLSKDETKTQATLAVFITTETDRLFKIYDSNWGEIESFHLGKNTDKYYSSGPISACAINENIFILSGKHTKYTTFDGKKAYSYFHVFNFSSKKLFSLVSDPRLCKTKSGGEFSDVLKYTLLNIRNEIYNFVENGEIFKYSFELNRWTRFAEPEPDQDQRLRFASDGNRLFRMYKITQTNNTADFIMEEYNFEQKSWISVPNSRLQVNLYRNNDDDSKRYGILREFLYLNDNGFAALFERQLFRFDQLEETWRNIDLRPYNDYNHSSDLYGKHYIIGQKEPGQMLYVINNKLHRLDRSDNSWELIKEWPLLEKKIAFTSGITTPYNNIVAIHIPYIHV